jgi:hypothetical protein
MTPVAARSRRPPFGRFDSRSTDVIRHDRQFRGRPRRVDEPFYPIPPGSHDDRPGSRAPLNERPKAVEHLTSLQTAAAGTKLHSIFVGFRVATSAPIAFTL